MSHPYALLVGAEKIEAIGGNKASLGQASAQSSSDRAQVDSVLIVGGSAAYSKSPSPDGESSSIVSHESSSTFRLICRGIDFLGGGGTDGEYNGVLLGGVESVAVAIEEGNVDREFGVRRCFKREIVPSFKTKDSKEVTSESNCSAV